MSDCNDPNHYDPADEIARATASLRARIAELEEGNVRRQVALEARIAELEREVVRVDGERCDLEADLQDETGLSCEDGLRDMVFELVGLWRKSKARADELEREVGYRSTGLMSGVQASVVLNNARLVGRIAELERERDEARKLLEYSGGANLLSDLNAARSDAARLREALGDFLGCPMVVSEGTNPVIVTIHVARERVEKWRAALRVARAELEE